MAALKQLIDRKIEEALQLQALAFNREQKNLSVGSKKQSFRGSIFTNQSEAEKSTKSVGQVELEFGLSHYN